MQKIPEFDNYAVDELGRIFSYRSGIYVAHNITRKGYHLVHLYRDGKRKAKTVHRLVAEAFIPNPDNKAQVNHKDGDKNNNNATNLEWATSYENMQHAADNGLLLHLQYIGKRSVPVKVYDYKTGEFKSSHPTITKAAEHYGVGGSSIGRVISGEYKHTHGLTFKKI